MGRPVVWLLAFATFLGAGPSDADRVGSLLGSWTCYSAANTAATHVYARVNATTITMENTFKAPSGEDARVVETYSLDGNTWSLSSIVPGTTYHFDGKGPQWTADTWEIAGTQWGARFNFDVRVIYTMLADGSFVRSWQFQRPDKHWQPYSAEVCSR